MGTHHTLINGTAYAIKGGTGLIAGTKCQIGGGRTLVDGTVYEIGFGPETITITITGSAYTDTDEVHNRAFVRINDTNYYNPASLTVEAGASIYARAYGGGSLAGRAAVYFNGSNKGTTYSFTADKDITIKLSAFGSGSNYYGTVAITTQ